MSPLSRRNVTIGAIAATAAAVGAVYEAPRLFKPRAKGQYAEIVNLLDEPDKAAVVGRAIRDAAPERTEAELKKRLHGRKLTALVEEDLPHIDRMAEAQGWVIPATLAEVCVLAAG